MGSYRYPQLVVDIRHVSGVMRLRRVQQERVGGLSFWPGRGHVQAIPGEFRGGVVLQPRRLAKTESALPTPRHAPTHVALMVAAPSAPIVSSMETIAVLQMLMTHSVDTDCSAQVDATASCANSTWIMYARPSSAVSPYFCCEPGQIALLPNLCVPNNGTYAASLLAPMATQAVGPASSNTPGSSTTPSGTSTSAKNTETSSTGSATPGTSGTSGTESKAPGSTETGTTTIVPETSSASSISTPKAGGAESLRSADWLWGVGVLVIALGFGMRLIM
ncbi:hypothetical protein NA56DRAFT_665476 [Hyaloscypha hepaticicola]|uniref:Uncharacterized protein n=1 Tax=Hyaloscypha hepaticicola TaxID=2082293 RepID=A0A2J6PHM5_9HELO|nr:hypothetical protein NA56DRAFT_665476 [Hyaloscypha hepaticicola]